VSYRIATARLAVAAITVGLLSAGVRAEDCRAELETAVAGAGTVTGVSVQPSSRPVSVSELPMPLKQFERVVIDPGGTSMVIVQTVHGEAQRFPLDSGTTRVSRTVLPCPSRQGLAGAWDAFWGVLNPHIDQPQHAVGATRIYRGLESAGESVTTGPLRELTNLLPAKGFVGDAPGVAFAWAGGTPPYSIDIEDDASGAPLVHGETAAPLLWRPDWAVPRQSFVLIVRDAEGVELWRHLRPLAPAPVSDGDLGDAIQLFQDSRDYRLEALRRLVRRAEGDDALARKAIETVQLSGSAE